MNWASATRISCAPLRPNICGPSAACCCARATPDTSTKTFYEGRYCVFDNLYVTDNTDPVDCPLCGRPAEIVSEENYFFKLSAFQDRLLQLYKDQPDFIRPAFRRNEIVRFVESGLRDISVSRKTVKWGLPWPDDPDHVVYVWYDALTSYLSGIGYGDDELQWEKYWPAQLHLIGKEIIRFHCVYWPAFLWRPGSRCPRNFRARLAALRSAEDEQVQGQCGLCRAHRARPGRGRLALLPAARRSFGQDGNFSHDALLTRYNSDLANGLGNLASRTLAMIERYCGGEVPSLTRAAFGELKRAPGGRRDAKLRAAVAQIRRTDFFARARNHLGRHCRRWMATSPAQKPWTLAEDPEHAHAQFETVLYHAAEVAAHHRRAGASRAAQSPQSRSGASSDRSAPWPSCESTSSPGDNCQPGRASARPRRISARRKKRSSGEDI